MLPEIIDAAPIKVETAAMVPEAVIGGPLTVPVIVEVAVIEPLQAAM